MSDISQVELAGAAVVAGGAAVTGVVPDPSQAVGATEKCNILHSNCIFVVKLFFYEYLHSMHQLFLLVR